MGEKKSINESEDRKNLNENRVLASERRRKRSFIGFMISILLLIVAISMAVNQEKNERLAREAMKANNISKIASSDISKNINEVKEKKAKEKQENSATSTSGETNGNTGENNSSTSSESSSDKINEERNGDAKLVSATAKNINSSNASKNSEDETGESKEKEDEKFIMPYNDEIIRPFSMDSLVYSNTLQEWVTHRGIDIKGEMYEDVKASKSGTIKSIKNDPRFGMSVIIEHSDGFKTVYSCLLGTADGLTEGMAVSQGQVIGKMGNSGVFETSDGVHLHFEMQKDGEYVNPEIYLK
jgi:murein DD-endopeptidase MepM/ murein hydrolase activator NlpD